MMPAADRDGIKHATGPFTGPRDNRKRCRSTATRQRPKCWQSSGTLGGDTAGGTNQPGHGAETSESSPKLNLELLRYIMHCHNVVHEDHAMMVRFDIGNKST
jgi:hypothetical protein